MCVLHIVIIIITIVTDLDAQNPAEYPDPPVGQTPNAEAPPPDGTGACAICP